MPLTPEDVDNTRFTTVRLREGYDMQEVDLFLDEVQEELARLNRENDELRDRLAAVMGDATVGEGRQQDQSAVRPIQSETQGRRRPPRRSQRPRRSRRLRPKVSRAQRRGRPRTSPRPMYRSRQQRSPRRLRPRRKPRKSRSPSRPPNRLRSRPPRLHRRRLRR